VGCGAVECFALLCGFGQAKTIDMPEVDIQIVSNEAGEEIASERETAYLLKSDKMWQRLLTALEGRGGMDLEEAVAKLGL
jgi:hypothetical protein